MKKIALVPALVALLFAGVVSAQTYAPNYTGGCVNLASDLSYGSRGSEVSKLQEFLVSQNYPGGGSWMVTGYFGQATVTAVRNFQQTTGISMTGFVDAQTRAAIQSRTCGFPGLGSLGGPVYTAPAPAYSTPSLIPSYPVQSPSFNQFGNAPTLGSLSLYSGVPGTLVTVYGSNFDQYTNTVNFGPSSVVASSNSGTQLSFVVPALASGSYQISISNSRGVSNSMTFSVSAAVGTQVPGCVAGIVGNSTCCSSWSNNQACGPLSLSYLTPNAGSVGDTVTIYGTGFSPTGNTVHFGQGVIANARSFDGRSVSFTVPTVLSGYGAAQVTLGSYPVSVTNAYGESSNPLPFNVTSVAGTPNVVPVVINVTGPTSLATGVQGTWALTLGTISSSYVTTTVHWGDENLSGVQNTQPTTLLQNQKTITLTHTYSTPGTYAITFTVTSPAGSTVATATVVVGGSSGGPSYLSLSSLNPASGHVGTTVTITGNGFSSSDNVVHFGVGGQRNVPSYNGTSIQYTIPTYVSPCDVIQGGYVCGAPVTSVTPGTYSMYVTNNSGATNVLYFTVTQ